jgi:hypothetical protein
MNLSDLTAFQKAITSIVAQPVRRRTLLTGSLLAVATASCQQSQTLAPQSTPSAQPNPAVAQERSRLQVFQQEIQRETLTGIGPDRFDIFINLDPTPSSSGKQALLDTIVGSDADAKPMRKTMKVRKGKLFILLVTEQYNRADPNKDFSAHEHADHETLVLGAKDKIVWRCNYPFKVTLEKDGDYMPRSMDQNNPNNAPNSPVGVTEIRCLLKKSGSYNYSTDPPIEIPTLQNTDMLAQRFYKFNITVYNKGAGGTPDFSRVDTGFDILDPDIVLGEP